MIRIRRGFTLPEVCVALTVFSVGTTGLLACWNFFNREVGNERLLLERYDHVAATMESLVAEAPPCADTLFTRTVPVRLERVPGSRHLAWAVAEQDGLSLKRLIRCK